MKEKVLISFSGGKTSGKMTHDLLNNRYEDYEMIVCFSNTGKEREETLEFVRDCDKFLGFNTVWVESVVHHGKRKSSGHKVVTFETASRNGEPYEEMIKKYGIPNVDFPHCTRELKTNPIHSYIKSVWGSSPYKTAIGIRADEVDRIRQGDFIYPLIKPGITKKDVEDFWNSMFFTLQLKPYEGNCNKCFKKTLAKLIQIQRDERSGKVAQDNWWNEIEKKYENYIPPSQHAGRKAPIRFNRQHMSFEFIDELSKLSDEDIKAVMAKKEIDLNLPNGCSESCEAF